MSLNLDARQRAMLLEMGISVWAPTPASAPVPAAAPAMAAAPSGPAAPEATVYRDDDVPAVAPAPVAARPAPAPRAAPTPPAPERSAAPDGTPALRIGAPQALYPQADAAAVPPELGAAWLIVAESPTPSAPLDGDAGRLLDNMLRAMRLHQHPRVFLATLERTSGDGAAPAGALQQALAAVQPAMVLLLGLPAARAALDVRDPLGRLRAGSHVLADGTPAIVTYDPAYLLRAPDAKAGAWADLCRALVLVRDAAAR